MIKLLIGGSPCTYWSIAKNKGRDTQPSGLGWQLFENYLIAIRKFKPDYFLYENNKSISLSIKEKITEKLEVNPILINSALVSAQNRQRLYWTNIPNVKQPEDRNIILSKILSGVMPKEGRALTNREMAYMVRTVKDGRNHFDFKHYHNSTRDKSQCITANICRGVPYNVIVIPAVGSPPLRDGWVVNGGNILVDGHPHHIDLADGFYIIRKLTVRECARLQTIPDDYIFPVSDRRAYKMIGNGWTVDVISHILHYVPKISAEPVEVLSMYDGMSCGRLALNKLGVNVCRYYSMEIDKYAIKTTQANFPDTVQLGDAFQIRDERLILPK